VGRICPTRGPAASGRFRSRCGHLVALPPQAPRSGESCTRRRCFAGFPGWGVIAIEPPCRRLKRRRFDAAISAEPRRAFELEARDSNSLARAARFVNARAMSRAGFRAACKRIWTARNMGFCNFFTVPSRRGIGGHEPKPQRASREPLL
jgi:hypothetical protein